MDDLALTFPDLSAILLFLVLSIRSSIFSSIVDTASAHLFAVRAAFNRYCHCGKNFRNCHFFQGKSTVNRIGRTSYFSIDYETRIFRRILQLYLAIFEKSAKICKNRIINTSLILFIASFCWKMSAVKRERPFCRSKKSGVSGRPEFLVGTGFPHTSQHSLVAKI